MVVLLGVTALMTGMAAGSMAFAGNDKKNSRLHNCSNVAAKYRVLTWLLLTGIVFIFVYIHSGGSFSIAYYQLSYQLQCLKQPNSYG